MSKLISSKFISSLLHPIKVATCLVVCAGFVQAQVTQPRVEEPRVEAPLWRYTAPASDISAIVQVELDGAMGTGVIICIDKQSPVGSGYAGFCLTANHVVEADKGRRAVRVTYRNGRVASRCKVLASDSENDVALLWVWVPKGIRAAPVAAKPVERNRSVHFSGLGGGASFDNVRHFKGITAPPTTSEKIFAPVSLLPGDSGGPVFDERGEVVGVISGGWLWFTANKPEDTSGMQATWPARACNLNAISKLIANTVVCLPQKRQEAATQALVAAE